MVIRGTCHCGNITFEFRRLTDSLEIPARACTCSFCVKHGGVWTAECDAQLTVAAAEVSMVSRYAFGTRTATFHICMRCGIVPVATSEIAERVYAVVNVNAFEDVAPARLTHATVDFGQEDVASRLERRARSWIANVHGAAA